jgi:osmotically-inducible protein OsmY
MHRSHTLSAFTIALVALCAVPVATSCSTTQPAKEQAKDSGITAKVKAKFIADPEVAAHNISVETSEGVVYLTGRVADERQRTEAERLARGVEGVVDVVNHLKVGDKT